MELLIEELYIDESIDDLLGEHLSDLPISRYPEAIAVALILRHSWRADDLACAVEVLEMKVALLRAGCLGRNLDVHVDRLVFEAETIADVEGLLILVDRCRKYDLLAEIEQRGVAAGGERDGADGRYCAERQAIRTDSHGTPGHP